MHSRTLAGVALAAASVALVLGIVALAKNAKKTEYLHIPVADDARPGIAVPYFVLDDATAGKLFVEGGAATITLSRTADGTVGFTFSGNPTNASVPFSLTANGSVQSGYLMFFFDNGNPPGLANFFPRCPGFESFLFNGQDRIGDFFANMILFVDDESSDAANRSFVIAAIPSLFSRPSQSFEGLFDTAASQTFVYTQRPACSKQSSAPAPSRHSAAATTLDRLRAAMRSVHARRTYITQTRAD